MTDIHNNGLLGEGKSERFYVDVGRIIGNFHFSIVPKGTLGVNISSKEGVIFVFGGLGRTCGIALLM